MVVFLIGFQKVSKLRRARFLFEGKRLNNILVETVKFQIWHLNILFRRPQLHLECSLKIATARIKKYKYEKIRQSFLIPRIGLVEFACMS